jgi:hypothetical protein
MAPMENREKFTELADDMDANPDKYGGANSLLRRVINDLRNGEYDDFENEKYPTPKMQMIGDFQTLGREDIVEQIKNGDFDQ